MPKLHFLASLLLLTVSASAQAASTTELLDQGRWAEAVDQAEQEKDYLTASRAMNYLMECPSASQPRGQNWTMPLARRGYELAKQAVKQYPSGPNAAEAYTQLGSQVGLVANVMFISGPNASNMADLFKYSKESKAAFDKAVQLDPNDTLALANLATMHAKTYKTGGIVYGATKGDAQLLISRAAKRFNEMPDATREQQIDKSYAAVRIGTALEGLSDKKLQPYFEAAIKLGEQAGGPRGLCAANLARVHLGRAVTDFK